MHILDGSDSYGRGSYAQHTRIKKPSKNTSSVSGGKAPPPLPVEVSPPKNYNEGRAMNNPKDRLAFSKAPRNVDYQPNTKPITRGDYVEIQNLKPDLNREVRLIVFCAVYFVLFVTSFHGKMSSFIIISSHRN